jgi:hypothetical protein
VSAGCSKSIASPLLGHYVFFISCSLVLVWGNNIPVGWAWEHYQLVFYIGTGHAGTLISAILHLCRQKWRSSINRAAEAMTLLQSCARGFSWLFTRVASG